MENLLKMTIQLYLQLKHIVALLGLGMSTTTQVFGRKPRYHKKLGENSCLLK